MDNCGKPLFSAELFGECLFAYREDYQERTKMR